MKWFDVDRNFIVSVWIFNGLECWEIWEFKGLDCWGFGEICEFRESCLMCLDFYEFDEMKRYLLEVKEVLFGVKFVVDYFRSVDKDNLVSLFREY